MSKEIIRIESTDTTVQMGKLYQQAFFGPPWNEAFVEDGQIVPCNSDTLPRFLSRLSQLKYPRLERKAYIEDELEKPGCVAYLLGSKKEPLGIGWGYPTTITDLAYLKWEEKPNAPERVIGILSGILGTNPVFYISEVFVGQREKGIGTELTKALYKSAPRNMTVCYRTLNDSPMTIIARKLGMVAAMGPQETLGGYTNFPPTDMDPINPSRVFYYATPQIRGIQEAI